MKKSSKMKKFGFTRKILDDFQDFVSECVFPEKINNPFWEGHSFSEEKCQFSLGVNKNTHFTEENQRIKSLRSAPLSIIFLSENTNIQQASSPHFQDPNGGLRTVEEGASARGCDTSG